MHRLVNMAADWCMVFKVFDLLLLSFLHKNTSEDLKKLFFSKIFCYLFRAFVHDRWFDSLTINTYLVSFMISVLI